MELYGIDFFDLEDFSKLLFKFGINFIFLIIIVRLVYYRVKDDKDYLFTYIMFNILTFFICFLLRKVPMEMGFALGLFAVFGILRYRTEAIPIRQMTYLFIVIGISMINALSNKSVSIFEVLFTNGLITLITYLIDRLWFQSIEENKTIIYEKIDLIKPDKKEDMIKDLRNRTGLPVHEFKVDKIDFLKDVAYITIYYNRE